MMFGIDRQKKKQPHRLHKHKPKFTHDHDSLKSDKQIANRASRRKAKEAIKSGKDIPIESKHSVLWNYW